MMNKPKLNLCVIELVPYGHTGLGTLLKATKELLNEFNTVVRFEHEGLHYQVEVAANESST